MEIETLRDWVIVIYGFLGIGATLLLIVLLILIYRKLVPILNSAKEAADNVRNTSSVVSEHIINPIGKARGWMTGARKVAETVNTMRKKKGGDNEKRG